MVNNEAPANLAILDITQASINNSVEPRTLVTGSLGSGDIIDYGRNVRLVINLKADVEISGGIGTINDLYTIKKRVKLQN